MGDYNPNHKHHFICIECRVGAKELKASSILKDIKRKCQHCGKSMIWVSVTFRIPKKNDDKAWKFVEKEILKGNRFTSKWYAR